MFSGLTMSSIYLYDTLAKQKEDKNIKERNLFFSLFFIIAGSTVTRSLNNVLNCRPGNIKSWLSGETIHASGPKI